MYYGRSVIKDTSAAVFRLVATGSFKPLSPVPNSVYGDDGEYSFNHSLFDKVFVHKFQLRANLQTSERDLAECVNEPCEGTVWESSIKLISTLNKQIHVNDNTKVLFATNFDVQMHNHDNIEQIQGEVHIFCATETGENKY